MNGFSFLRRRGKLGDGGRLARRALPGLVGALIAVFVFGLAASSGTSAVGTTFTVDTTDGTTDGICGGASDCSFGDAIEAANANAGKDTIAFTGPLSIALESELPAIRNPVDIVGTTQPECAGSPRVEVQGTGTPHNHNGLVLNAGDSTVCGLVLNRLYNALQVNSSDNRIEGNFIGTDVAGAAALANENVGIVIFSGARNHVDRNVISGNRGYGLETYSDDISGNNVIQGNHFGTNATGTAALPNGGLDLSINSDNDVIGGTVAAARNVIAGNVLIGQTSTGAVVQGNYFGTDETGGSALVPRGGVLQIQGTHSTIGGSAGVTLSGPCTGACNVFANGLSLSAPFGEAGNHVVQGNFVGTDSSGVRAVGGGSGVGIADSTDNLIGGTDPAERNLISGNALKGVLIANTSFRNRIVGNFIGTDASGTRPLPNGEEGVLCCGSGFGDDNTIERNIIAFNRSTGVQVVGASGVFETVGNAILGNSIFANGGLGIALGDGPTQNDPGDGDTGPNGHQNFPVITGVSVDNGVTTIEGTLNSIPDSTYHVELFRNRECDPSHFGEGETFLGSLDVPGNGSTFTVTYPVALSATEVVTSTATDSRNNTSEFSECLADLSITKSDDPDPVAVGTPLTYAIDVANAGPAPANAVRVTDTLPPDVTVTSIPPSCETLGSTVTCALGSIGRGGTARVTIVVNPGSTPRTLTNNARVSSELRDPNESDNLASATTQVVNAHPTATIVVRKVTQPAGDSAQFEFAGDAPGTIGDGETIDVVVLAPGTYTATEAVPMTGWDLKSISCDDGDSNGDVPTATATFRVATGEKVTCTFTDSKRGTVVVKKRTNPVGTSGVFSFSGDVSGSIGDGGELIRADLPTINNAVFSAAEADPAPAFDLAEIGCVGDTPGGRPSGGAVATRTATFRLDPGETVTCTFTNARRATLAVSKTVSGSPITGLLPSDQQSFTFQLRRGASTTSAGTLLEQEDANAANGGRIEFASRLVANGPYQLCEIVMPGWRTSLSMPFVLFNASAENSTLCTDFRGVPGETKSIAVDNRPPPGGLARTIGFWKNWASCAASKGKQRPVLDQTLAAAEPVGISIGTLTLRGSDCLKAVRLLDKSTIDTGNKQASDPAFNAAAQLLAARLNVKAGAATCPSAVGAINDAQALLAATHFDGITHNKLTAIQAAQANTLATTLDRYNNGLLC